MESASDRYARIRTGLANERTLLAYARTGLGFAAAGATVLRFLEGGRSVSLGAVLVAAGCGCFLLGAFRYASVRKALDPAPPAAGDGPA